MEREGSKGEEERGGVGRGGEGRGARGVTVSAWQKCQQQGTHWEHMHALNTPNQPTPQFGGHNLSVHSTQTNSLVVTSEWELLRVNCTAPHSTHYQLLTAPCMHAHRSVQPVT